MGPRATARVQDITTEAELTELLGEPIRGAVAKERTTLDELDRQVLSHCAEAFLRSELWDPASRAPDAVPLRAVIAHRLERRDQRLEDIERYYGEQYSAGLHPAT
ncbi:hypothetical protein SAMN05660209_02873 [Geodermatophilus africanus]|uniref:Uncharacterized protein n=1 Tax=Geodermatophilus africanus TaxID=1137993 RepID=A0A1H3JXQ3_9ACTN|nr:hypothetical protein SAMN05660209_02873 [Geodermatophilus africanus]